MLNSEESKGGFLNRPFRFFRNGFYRIQETVPLLPPPKIAGTILDTINLKKIIRYFEIMSLYVYTMIYYPTNCQIDIFAT